MRKIENFFKHKTQNSLSNLINGYPESALKSFTWWGRTQQSITVYVDSATGDDNSDGFSWANCVATLPKALSIIDNITGSVQCQIAIAGGTVITETDFSCMVDKRLLTNESGLLEICGVIGDWSQDTNGTLTNNGERTSFPTEAITFTGVEPFFSLFAKLRALVFENGNPINAFGKILFTSTSGYWGLACRKGSLEIIGIILSNRTFKSFGNLIITYCQVIETVALGGSVWRPLFFLTETKNSISLSGVASFSTAYPFPVPNKPLVVSSPDCVYLAWVNYDALKSTFGNKLAFNIDSDLLDLTGAPLISKIHIGNKYFSKAEINVPATSYNVEFSDTTTFFQIIFKDGIVNYNLPTADPLLAGKLWNNAGVLTVSAG